MFSRKTIQLLWVDNFEPWPNSLKLYVYVNGKYRLTQNLWQLKKMMLKLIALLFHIPVSVPWLDMKY